MMRQLTEITETSKIPKYKQVADYIVSNIGSGTIQSGDKIPSINEISTDFHLSRDTVEKAYNDLRKRGIILSVKSKGFYVASSSRCEGRRILLIFNKLSDHKKAIFNAFRKRLEQTSTVDLQIHCSDDKTLQKIVVESLGKYDYYIIMPHLQVETAEVKSVINKIPKEKLILINKDLEGITGEYGCVFEDFPNDIRYALNTELIRFQKYNKLILIFPTQNYYCGGIKNGFIEFCVENNFSHEIVSDATGQIVNKGELYIVIEESDLVEIIKKVKEKNLSLGKNIGIISYNDSPFKEILAGGISVLSTDFELMGDQVAEMILTGVRKKIKNPFSLLMRGSV